MNQPSEPRSTTGSETEYSSAAASPAAVPPTSRTSANTTSTVSEPTTTGNITAKSYRSAPAPNAWYAPAAVACSITWDVADMSRPCPYQLSSSCHSMYSARPFSTMNSVAR